MRAARRSSFLQIATICLAVFLSYTARMAASVGEAFPGTPPCSSKVVAESPTPQNQLKQRIHKSIRPQPIPSYQTNFFNTAFGVSPARTPDALTALSLQTNKQASSIAPQSLPSVLRI